MSGPPEFAKEHSNRFHRELDLAELRSIRESMLDPSDEYFETLPADQQAEVRATFAEQVRALDVVIARDLDTPADAVPCDVFTFKHGEAPDRAMTKLGGLPYWPADRPWPTTWRGKPLSFLGQINFCDSRDVVGELPGAILVMFINRRDRIQSFWLDPTDQPLIAAESIPDYERKFGNSHGVIHRTYGVPGRTLSDEASVGSGVELSIFDLKIGGVAWGRPGFLLHGSSVLFQMEAPGEVFESDDGSEWITRAGMICRDYRWPWSKRDDDEPEVWQTEWWAACLKRNGKLRWSWA